MTHVQVVSQKNDVGHCYKRRAVALEISGSRVVDSELIRRRWLDRKSLASGIIAGNDDAVEWKPRSNTGREDEDDDDLFGYDDGTTAITVLTKVKVKKTLNWIEPLFVGSMLPGWC
jgi:hypothetical protein